MGHPDNLPNAWNDRREFGQAERRVRPAPLAFYRMQRASDLAANALRARKQHRAETAVAWFAIVLSLAIVAYFAWQVAGRPGL